jgi:putative FmdB family regulatory protein
MPIYDFECEKCAYYTEIKQRMEDPSAHECPHCGDKTLVKVFINPPAMFFRGEPHTIGQLANRNTQKMGTYELQDKQNQDRINNNTEETQKRETHKRINAMTPEKRLKWIHTGE